MTDEKPKGLRRRVKDGEITEEKALELIHESGGLLHPGFRNWIARRIAKRGKK